MPLWLFPTLFAVSVIVTLVAAIWLLLHLTALARTFAGTADIVPSPKPANASRRAVRFVGACFVLGLLTTLTLQILAFTGVANEWIG
jgi:hypothetical protein